MSRACLKGLGIVQVHRRNASAPRCSRTAGFEKVYLFITFPCVELVSASTVGIYLWVNVVIIAIDMPRPGAHYFGANVFEAVFIAGRHLGRWAKKYLNGKVDEVLLV